MYRDPSVGNLINIMVVKLVIIHNEQVGTTSPQCSLYAGLRYMADIIAGVCGLEGFFSPFPKEPA